MKAQKGGGMGDVKVGHSDLQYEELTFDRSFSWSIQNYLKTLSCEFMLNSIKSMYM